MASKPCLPVTRRRKAQEDAHVEFEDIATMDATEYLSRVMQQSNRLPEIMHRSPQQQQQQHASKKYKDHVPIEGSAASLSYLVSDRTAILPPPTAAHLPTENTNTNDNCAEWVDQTLANFSQLRLFLDKSRSQQQQKKSTKEQPRQKQPVPTMKDRPGWHIFCLGKEEAHGNAGSYFAGDTDNDDDEQKMDGKDEKDDTNNGTNNDDKDEVLETKEPWEKDLPGNGFYPSTSLLLQLDQVMLKKVIAHLAHYVQEGWYPCSVQRTLWLYALLARLEKPLHRNDAAVLYGLLKSLTRSRATMTSLVEKDREGLARLNVLIAIIGIYFEQGGGYAAVMEVKK